MEAWILDKPAKIETKPLHKVELADKRCSSTEIRLDISVCGICHTDLHVVEGDLELPVLPIVPGHQIVGKVVETGKQVTRFKKGERVGVAWLYSTCMECEFCNKGLQNLCPDAKFTGFHVNGGFANEIVIDEHFAYAIPDNYTDLNAAPLLCAGIVGFRALRVAGIQPGERVGLYGFGASAHLAIQILNHWKCQVYVFSRNPEHRKLAEDLGAVWTGLAGQRPPKQLHRAVIYAPAGWIMVEALKDVGPAGVVTSGGIHMSSIPEFPYAVLWEERTMNSVANATTKDGDDFLTLAKELTLHTEIEVFQPKEVNNAMLLLKNSKLKAAAVLDMKG